MGNLEAFKTSEMKLSQIEYIQSLAIKIPGVVSLAQGIPSAGTSNIIKRAAIRAIKEGLVDRYSRTAGIPQLKKAVSKKVLKDDCSYYDPDGEIIITVGIMEAVTVSLLTLVTNGDEVIVLSPTYTHYFDTVKLAGGKLTEVPLSENRNWGINLERVKKAISPRTKVLIVCNPNNPTGSVFSKKELGELVELALRYDFYIIADQTYREFIYDGFEFTSLASFSKARDRIIICEGFSKTYAMTGWRVGYLLSGKKVVSELIKFHNKLVICAPVVSQFAAWAALEKEKDFVSDFVLELSKKRKYIIERLEKLSGVFSFNKPLGSYYIFVKTLFSNLTSTEIALMLLNEAKVATVPGRAFGKHGEGHLRMCFGVEHDKIALAFDYLDKYFSRK